MIDATFTVTAPTPDAGKHPRQPPVPPAGVPGPRRGFTLVEMLTVVVIIGILASLITGVVIRARIRGKITVIGVEINQLDMALKQYKQKHGEYPPDFTNTGTTQGRAAVIRHLSKAFPRFVLSGDTDTKWTKLQIKLLRGYGVDLHKLDPAAALVFWLGGLPEGRDSMKLIGFSANPRDPFDFGEDVNGNGQLDGGEDINNNGELDRGSRLPPLFEFDPKRLKKCEHGVFRYYPEVGGGGETAPYVYFRGGSRGYDGHPGFASTTHHPEWGSTGPCRDTRVPLDGAGTKFDWINGDSFQIRATGLDGVFGSGTLFPTGEDYDSPTYDDQTNFSKGTLEDEM